jgi:tRNA(adenine34) deaminase
MNVANDGQGMQAALAQAGLAAQSGEVPVGAVVVKDGQIIARAFNAPISTHDPCAHAEVLALRAAGQALQNYRLEGCTLYVTVEPCAMCAGAILHARLPRVVFGASEPKTGAAGSVLNVFAEPLLNHHTQVTGGVMAADCAAIMARFFQDQRAQQRVQGEQLARTQSTRLRPDAVRTPDARFENLPGYPWPPRYISDSPSLDGLRMHYLDVPPSKGRVGNGSSVPANRGRALTYVCLHGNPAWSYLYRKMIPVFAEAGHRVLAPDLIGFGKSDKPKKEAAHSFSWHRQVLLEWVDRLDLRNIVLVVQDWGGLLGLTLPMASPERFAGLLVMNTMLATAQKPLSAGFLAWRDMCTKNPEFDVARLFARGNPQMSPQECAAYMAPFPDAGHRAALRRFAPMVPELPADDGAAVSRQAEQFWQTQWRGQTLMAIGAQDPVLGPPVMATLQQRIHACPEALVLPHAGHFVPEHGEAIARVAVGHFH